ncbi:MAG: hypothetical protein LIR46_07720 [Bacteroidota bacterium]|nr:hypothetical protein [Bacteroidota bacterium]
MKTYEDGINEAWNATKKIFSPVDNGGLSTKEIYQIFNETRALYHIFEDYTGQEAITKIEEYDKNNIKVGDEIKYLDSRGVVIEEYGEEEVVVLWSDGGIGTGVMKQHVTKTGRHFPQIEEILKKMQEEEE